MTKNGTNITIVATSRPKLNSSSTGANVGMDESEYTDVVEGNNPCFLANSSLKFSFIYLSNKLIFVGE